mgnify:CR=1 FL=1
MTRIRSHSAAMSVESPSFRVVRPVGEPPRTLSTPVSARPPSRHEYSAQQPRRNPITEGDELPSYRSSKKAVPEYFEHMHEVKEVQRHKRLPTQDAATRAGRSSQQESVERFGKKRVPSPEHVVHQRSAKKVIPVESRNPIVQGEDFCQKEAHARGLRRTTTSSFQESEEDPAFLARRISKSVQSHPPQSSLQDPVYLGGNVDNSHASNAGIRRFEHKTHSHKDVMMYTHAGKISEEGARALTAREAERKKYEEDFANALKAQQDNRSTYEALRRKLRSDKTNPALENFLYDGTS